MHTVNIRKLKPAPKLWIIIEEEVLDPDHHEIILEGEMDLLIQKMDLISTMGI